MSLAISWGLSLATGAQASPCPVSLPLSATSQIVRTRMSDCCSSRFEMCILQNADKSFVLTDSTSSDFSTATEITFDVWNSISGTNLLSYSLTGGELSVVDDYKISFTIPNADSAELPPGRRYAEAWVTFADGTRIGAKGVFIVQDTRKHDA